MDKHIIVGGTLRDAAGRVADAWKKAEAGELATPQDNITFVSWSALSSVMTDKRHALLQHLHQHPAKSIRALSRDVGRDFKRIHEDVTALENVGLIERDEHGHLTARYGQIQATILLDASAA
jgi:predicted transcriptional regulator